MTRHSIIACPLSLALWWGLAATPAWGQKKSDPEVMRLRAEVDRLRADLDAALRGIQLLKEAIRGGGTVGETGALFRGRPAPHWIAQLKDADVKTRSDAAEAIAELARKDKKLIPVLLDILKSDPGTDGGRRAADVLGSFGPETLPALMEIAKDKSRPESRRWAIITIGYMGKDAKPATSVLLEALAEKSNRWLLESTVRALERIDPNPKEAIPALVATLGVVLAEMDMPRSKWKLFETHSMSLNNLIFDLVLTLDPALKTELTRPSAKSAPGPGLAPALREAWQNVHLTLLRKYDMKR